jgi:hypothetical protein
MVAVTAATRVALENDPAVVSHRPVLRSKTLVEKLDPEAEPTT